jgi:hypothetical protein
MEAIEDRLVTAIPIAAVVVFLAVDLLLARLQLMLVGGWARSGLRCRDANQERWQ